MKKLLATGVALLLVASLTAQISFGPRAGFNLTNMAESAEGEPFSLDTDFRPGFQVGFVVDIPVVGDLLSIQPGLLFAQQGARLNFELFGEDIKSTISINYLQMPINAQLGFGIGNDARILLQAGPYLGFALGGNVRAEVLGETVTEDIEFGSGPEEMNRFDLGVGFGAGVQFGRIQVGVGYNLGFANLSNEEGTTSRNNGLALTVTYLFGGR